MSTTTSTTDEALQAARWDLEPLVDGGGSERALAQLDEAQERSDAFAERYRGKVAELDAPGLAGAMRELEAISDLAGRAGTYASLAFSVDTVSPEVGALMQRIRERSARLQTTLLFFDLEWNVVDDERAEELLAAEEIDFCRHYLRTERRYRPHQLTEPEERILTEASVTGNGAFARLFTELTSAITVDVSGADEPLQLMEALSRLQDPDRELRAEAAGAVTEALEPGLRTRAFIYNNLLQDKATRDRLRSFDHWLASRNLDNEAGDESVAALIEAVGGRYELARRWYRLKARMLGLERLADYDRVAPLAEAERTVSYTEARELVLDCYTTFSPELGDTAREFFVGDYIDAPPGPGKRGGAFCSYAVPSAHPYVMLNYTSRPGDVLTMAHELGHGVHAALARPRGVFEFGTPLTVAETASIFGETIVLGRLLEQAPDDSERLALLGSSLDGAVGAVFRQVAMNRFEDRVHTERRETGELSVDDFAAAWMATQTDLLGDSVDISDGYSSWWSYVPHFIATPGYVYAYSYGHLLALSVYSRYEQEGEGFVGSYLDLLRAGGSMAPEQLGEIVGVDLNDPGFWNAGLDLIERQLERAEATAAAVSGLIAAAAVALAAAALAVPQHSAGDRREVIGHSRQGRPIVARELGDPGAERRVLVVGSIHGNETQGERVVDRLRHHSRRLRRSELWTIETVNPDGVAAGTRGNAHSVDLNRNFATAWKPIPASSGYYSGPKPFSEPETRAVRRFLRRLRPDVTIWYHQPFGRTLIPCNRRGRHVALRYARLSGLAPRDCYPTPPGAATGWQDAALGEKAFVAEFGPGSLSRAQVRRHARAVLRIAG